MTEEQQKFYNIKHTSNYKTVGDDVDYKVIVDDEKKEVVLQFEESDSVVDWKNNLLFIPFPLKLENKIVWTTYGYAKAYKSTNGTPIAEFITECVNNPDYKVCIRGWSFGSAMAKIAVRHLANLSSFNKDEKIVDELTTFGDVKCWLNPFYSNKKHCKVIHEYSYVNDLVTWCVPFYSRDVNSWVGGKFSFKKLLNTEYNHTHYEEYDYS